MPQYTQIRCPYCGTTMRKNDRRHQRCSKCGRVVRDERESLGAPRYIY